jgi:hypothetical protein
MGGATTAYAGLISGRRLAAIRFRKWQATAGESGGSASWPHSRIGEKGWFRLISESDGSTSWFRRSVSLTWHRAATTSPYCVQVFRTGAMQALATPMDEKIRIRPWPFVLAGSCKPAPPSRIIDRDK